MTIDTTPLALAVHYARIERADCRDDLEQQAREEIAEAITADKSLACEGYDVDAEDFAYHCATKLPDFGSVLAAVIGGDLALPEVQKYLSKALDGYASFHATARADYLEQAEQDAAEDYGSDR